MYTISLGQSCLRTLSLVNSTYEDELPELLQQPADEYIYSQVGAIFGSDVSPNYINTQYTETWVSNWTAQFPVRRKYTGWDTQHIECGMLLRRVYEPRHKLRTALTYLQNNSEVRVLVIGHMRGKSNLLEKYLHKAHGWRGIYTAPAKEMYELWANRFAKLSFSGKVIAVNTVVAVTGNRHVFVPPVKVPTYSSSGIRSGKAKISVAQDTGEHSGKVTTTTLSGLLEMLPVGRIRTKLIDFANHTEQLTILSLNTQGTKGSINYFLKWRDLQNSKPSIICMNWETLDAKSKCDLVKHLLRNGYSDMDVSDNEFWAIHSDTDLNLMAQGII
eukprot:CFRG7914T1